MPPLRVTVVDAICLFMIFAVLFLLYLFFLLSFYLFFFLFLLLCLLYIHKTILSHIIILHIWKKIVQVKNEVPTN